MAERASSRLAPSDVAELAGITERWFTRFETGHATLSVSALDRVATVLRLNRTERLRLLDFAAQPITGRNALDRMLGIAMREPRASKPLELGVLEAAAAIVELTLSR